MRIFYKQKTRHTAECWAEVWNRTENEWQVVSDCRLILTAPQTALIDSLTIIPTHQRMGIGRAMVEWIQARGISIKPIGVLDSAIGFWDKVTPGWKVITVEEQSEWERHKL